jgi:hypothetical protein
LPIQGVALSNNARVAEYYYTLGLALARTNQCGEALPIAQNLQSNLSNDENASAAAAEIIKVCEENLSNPAVDTAVPTDETTTTPEATLEATSAPEVEVTATP